MSNKLYVGNLPYSTNDEDLKTAFAEFGNIEDVKIIQDRMTGRSRGFGFVTFSSADDAHRALEMNGHELQGRAITVSIAQDRPQGGGFRGDRGGRGGDRHERGGHRFRR